MKAKRKRVGSLLLTMVLIISILYNPIMVSAAGNKGNESKVVLYTGQQKKLKKANLNEKKAVWKVTRKRIVKIYKSGKIKARKKGTTIVYAKYKGKTYKWKVIVRKPHIQEKEVTLHVGGTKQINLIGTKIKSCKSRNEKVASVTEKGYVEALSPGEAEIAVKAENGKTYGCIVTVVGEKPVAATTTEQKPAATTTTEQKPAATTTTEQKPAATTTTEQKPAAATTTEQKPAAATTTEQRPAAATTTEQKPAAATTTEQKPAATTTTEQKPAAATTTEQKPAAATTTEQKPAATTTTEQKPAATTTTEQKPAAATTTEQKPAATTTTEQKPAATTTTEQKPAATTTTEQKPAAATTTEQKPATATTEQKPAAATTTEQEPATTTQEPAATTQAPAKNSIEELKQEMKQMVMAIDFSTHDIARYHLRYQQKEKAWNELCEEDDEVNIMTQCYGWVDMYTEEDANGYLTTMRIRDMDREQNHIDTPELIQKRYKEINRKLDEMLSFVNAHPEMTQMDKVLYVHNYIEETSYYKAVGYMQYKAGSILGDGYGVCEGYASAMMFVLSRMGINIMKMSSNPMNHAWNYVEVDGEWYHVDTCWDDKTEMAHNYFIRSDASFATNIPRPHYDWYYGSYGSPQTIKATSTKYDDWFVHDITGRMIYQDGYWYYRKGDSVMKAKLDGSYNEPYKNITDTSNFNLDDYVK